VTLALLERPHQSTYRSTYRRTCPRLAPIGSSSFWTKFVNSPLGNARSDGDTSISSLVNWRPIEGSGGTSKVDRAVRMNIEGVIKTGGRDRLLYSVAETARLLSCSRNTVYALIRSGELLPVYPTSRTRISAKSLERYVHQLEDQARSGRARDRRSVQ
jgi:excisionase family DNA binding protein